MAEKDRGQEPAPIAEDVMGIAAYEELAAAITAGDPEGVGRLREAVAARREARGEHAR